jgi:hypothetical protein
VAFKKRGLNFAWTGRRPDLLCRDAGRLLADVPARVAELADAVDSKSTAERLAGSTPAPGTSLRASASGCGYGWQASRRLRGRNWATVRGKGAGRSSDVVPTFQNRPDVHPGFSRDSKMVRTLVRGPPDFPKWLRRSSGVLPTFEKSPDGRFSHENALAPPPSDAIWVWPPGIARRRRPSSFARLGRALRAFPGHLDQLTG